MDAPGLSLFQGHTNININNEDVQNELEEEDRKEQEERNKELGNQLMNAFDDLDELDEDDMTVDSSANLISRISENDDDVYGHETPMQRRDYSTSNEDNEIIRNRLKLIDMQNNKIGGGDNYYNGLSSEPMLTKGDINYEEKYLDSKFSSIEQLSVLYEVRVREVQNLTIQLEEFRMHSEHTISELRKQLLLCEADKERAIASKEQTQELLVQTKSALGDYHNKIDSLNSTIRCLEQEKELLNNELLITKASLQDSYQRLQIIDKGLSNDKYLEDTLKNVKKNNAEEIKNLEDTINQMKNRLENSDISIKQLETRNRELNRERERLLIEKADTVNELAKKLQETQKQYQLLLTNSKTNDDMLKITDLEKKCNLIEEENHILKQEINEATVLLENLALQIDSESGFTNDNINFNDSFSGNNENKNYKKSNLSHDVFNLINRLHDCMQKYTKQIKDLSILLKNREEQIKSFKEQELLATHYREQAFQLKNELTLANQRLDIIESSMPKQNAMVVEIHQEKNVLQQECDKLKTEIMLLREKNHDLQMHLNEKQNDRSFDEGTQTKHVSYKKNDSCGCSFLKEEKNEEIRSLQLEINTLKFQLNDAQKEIDRYKTLYMEILVEKDKLIKDTNDFKSQDFVKNLCEMQNKVNRLEKELELANKKICDLNEELIEKSKKDNEKQVTSQICSDNTEFIKKLEFECDKLRENCSDYRRDIAGLNKKLIDASQKIHELEVDLETRKHRDYMIEDIKQKAQKFEEFMKQNMSRFKQPVKSPSKVEENNDNYKENKKTVHDKCVAANFDINLELSDNLHKNHQAEILKCEQKVREELSFLYSEEIKNIVDKHNSEKLILEDNFQKTLQVLQVRTKEVELLKNAILAERQTYSELIKQKNLAEKEKSSEMDREIINEYMQKVKLSEEKIKELTSTLDKNANMLQFERESNFKIKTELLEKNKHLKQKLIEMEKSFSHLSEKYLKSKKCTENYKVYIADQKKHFEDEVDRIKKGYDEAVVKVHNKMERAIEKGEKKAKDRLKEIELKYQSQLENIRSARSGSRH